MSTIHFDHIAIGISCLGDAAEILVGVLGGVPAYGGRGRGYIFGQWRYDGGGRLEVIEPAGDNGFLHRFLDQRGPGIHHVTFKVPDIDEARRNAEAMGHEIVAFDDSDPDWKTFFLHPRQALGIVVQLAQASGPEPPWTPPPSPPRPPAPVRLLGVRLRARSRERADRQWGELLQGRATAAADGAVTYRWPDSPLRLAVEIAPGASEGPIALEYTSAQDVDLPATPVPRLGTRFVRCPVTET